MKKILLALAKDELNSAPYWIPKFLIWVISLLYGFVVTLRNGLFDIGVLKSKKLPYPVISVGNITVGGAGKTPLVEYLTKLLVARGLKPAILTRGYMDSDQQGGESDEAQMLKARLHGVPVIVGVNRYRSAMKFLKENKVNVFIVDDGFQRRQLARDVNVVVISALDPWGNEYLLPRGLLREPLKSLKRADVLLITRVDQAGDRLEKIYTKLKQLGIDAPVAQSVYTPTQLLDLNFESSGKLKKLKGKTVMAVSSIAQPESFIETLKALDVIILSKHIFMDHHQYAESDIERIIDKANKLKVDCIITTAKDAVKLKKYIGVLNVFCPAYVVNVEVRCTEGEELFLERITACLNC